MGLLTREFETAPCVVEVSHRFDSLHAHVKFLNGATINPGDEVLVQGPPVMAPYGEVVREERVARITRASKVEQFWTRMTGDFEFMELCEFSFSDDVDAEDAPGNEPAPQVARSAVGEKGVTA
ncbi:MAG: Major Vault Protein repeat [Rhodobacteraceae bacterium HLUCCO18]|nr:MAG: Major Vault Protein repeat [Rhodobacteraceae bacterium HLUCCO18]